MGTISAPTDESRRLIFLDVLRGLAVLAIFAINIKVMFAPFAYYFNQSLWPGEFDMTVAGIQAFVIEDKWRTIFTMLFGAGIGLMTARAERYEADSFNLIWRRTFFLAVFGIIHLIAIWEGDILFLYAAAGAIVILFRNMTTDKLIKWAAILLAIAFVWMSLFSAAPALLEVVRNETAFWLWGEDQTYLEEITATMRGGVLGHLGERWVGAKEMIVWGIFLGGGLVETAAIMLFGLYFYKIGLFSAAYSRAVYAKMALLGLGAALFLDSLRWTALVASDWSFETFSILQFMNAADGYAGAIGYTGLVGCLISLGWRPSTLAAVGRMAFSNYIACSVIGTTLSYGHAGSLYGKLTNLELMGIVLATWIAMLIWSPMWLKRYHHGPVEWAWRSLTYLKRQPFRR